MSRWYHFLDLLEEVHADILVAVGLKDFASDLTALEACGMDKVAVLTAGAPVGPVVVAARDGAEVARLDDLIHVGDGLLSGCLLDLRHLSLAFLIDFLELGDGIVGKTYQHRRRLSLSLLQK